MPTDPTPDEVARAKKWAAMQTPPVTVTEYHIRYGHELDERPEWLGDDMDDLFPSEDAAWHALALALRPVFDSVEGVILDDVIELIQDKTPIPYHPAAEHYRGQLVTAIRAMS